MLITAEKLDILTSSVSLKLLAGEGIDRSQPTPENTAVNTDKRIAVIPVYGSLVNKNGAGSSGMTSYQNTKSRTMQAVQEGIKHIVFDVSSPGGEAAGAFPLADFINTLPTKYGVNTYGFTDSQAASGGYIILGAAQKVFATDIADVGSIGAVMSLVDVTEMDKADGIKYTILRSKDAKAAYNPHEVLSEKVVKDLQAKLQIIDDKFNSSIVKYRNGKLSMATITDLAGRTVTGTEALALGLVDSVVTGIEDVFAEIISGTTPVSKTSNITTNRSTTMSEVTLEKYVALQDELAAVKESSTLEVAKAVKAERNRCTKIMESASTFNVSTDTIVKAVSKGWGLDMVADYFSDLAEAKDALSAIQTGAGDLASADALQKAAMAKAAAENTGVNTFDQEIAAGIEALNKSETLFGGLN
jgi:ClpP class serine protease